MLTFDQFKGRLEAEVFVAINCRGIRVGLGSYCPMGCHPALVRNRRPSPHAAYKAWDLHWQYARCFQLGFDGGKPDVEDTYLTEGAMFFELGRAYRRKFVGDE